MSNDDSKPPVPSFSGHGIPMNFSTNVDEDELGEETTRRVGVAPSFQPSFEPMTFQPQPSFSTVPTFSTAPQKASASPMPVMTTDKSGGKPSGWKLVEAPMLPEFHPLDRTATFVAHTSASTVAQRISEILRERSIEATFDSTKAKVTCRTADNVDFRIRLYRGRNKYSHGIIVEVQRRFGSSVSFCEDSTAILDAAQGKVPPPPPSIAVSSKISALPPVSDVEDEEDASAASISSLDFVAKMLRHPGLDSHLLALQTLSSLTDPAKMGAKTAKAVSKALLDGSSDEIGDKIVSLVVAETSRGAAIDEDDDGRRLLALTILSNSLTVAGRALPPILRERVRPVLLKDLKSEKTQMAFLAARCFEAMLDGDHDLCELHVAMEKALATGEARHAGLYKQAKACIAKIERLSN